MTKLTVNPPAARAPAATASPSAQVMAKATESWEVEDTSGRTIQLRKPGMLAQFRLVEMLGDSSKNQVYLAMVTPLLYITAIDDDPVTPVLKKSELEALIQRLDESGVEAVHNAIMSRADAPADAEALKASLKN